MSSTGQLFLKPKDNLMELQNSKCSRPPYSAPQPAAASKNNGKGDNKKKNGHKKKSGKGGDVFRINGNTINGGKADKAGVFGFGNKYIGRKKQVEEDDDSTDEESDSSEDEG